MQAHPLAVPHLGGASAASPPAGASCSSSTRCSRPAPAGRRQLLLLHRRAHHRLHEPLEHLLRPGDVRAHHAGLVSAVRPRHVETRACGLLAAALLALAVLLAETRAVWIATAVAALYLVWFWRRWLVLLVPVAIVAGVLRFAPGDPRALHLPGPAQGRRTPTNSAASPAAPDCA